MGRRSISACPRRTRGEGKGIDRRELKLLLPLIAGLAAGYFAVGKLSLLLSIPPGYATAVWPPAGVALAALWRGGLRLWPGVWLGAVMLNFSIAGSLPLALAIAAGNTLEALAAAVMVQLALPGRDAPFDRVESPALLALAAVSCAVIAASVAIVALVLDGAFPAGNWALNWLTWWLGDAAGILITVPLILSWMRPAGTAWTRSRVLEAAALAATVLLALVVHFGPLEADGRFLLLPAVIWCAVRFGEREVTSLCVLLGGAAVVQLFLAGRTLEEPGTARALLLLQAYIATLVLAGLTLNILVRQLRRMNAILRQSHAELEEFMSLASHDLQEPLRNVLNFSELLDTRYGDRLDGDGQEFLGFVRRSASRMRLLIHDLLQVSRVSRGALPLERIDPESSLNGALENLRASITDSGALIRRGALPLVRANAQLLERVFQNLIANAIRYRAAEAPRIEVNARLASGEWIFSVSDNGIGIEARHHRVIFDMFERLRHDGADARGAGMGLALCRRIVEGHGGRMWVESAPSQGATFYFSLPTILEAKRG
jgi:signal transduction histidine kinase